MATAPKTDTQKVTEYRKMAMDKTLPQEVRDQADMKANAIEAKSVEAKTGMKLAKGGMAGKAAMKFAAKQPMKKDVQKSLTKVMEKAYPKGATITPKLAKGGAVAKKAPAKKMAVGGMAKKGCK